MTKMRMLLVFLATVPLATAVPTFAGGGGPAIDVRGGWVGELPCAITGVTLDPSSLTTAPFTCTSGTTWDGVWTGHTRYDVHGAVDVVSGDAWGTIDETLVGAVGGTPGTLHLVGTFDLDGATSTIGVDETIIGGTGGFAGSTGHVIFEGFQSGGAAGHGGYHGTWHHG